MTEYVAFLGDRIYAGKIPPVRNPSLSSAEWPPSPECSIPAAEGVNAPIHPGVIDFGALGWNGYRYWMAFTPYPVGDDVTKENPCVVASNDGNTWVAPRSNPIVPAPPGASASTQFYSDTDLVFFGGALFLIYREVDRRTSGRQIERLWSCATTDGINYSAPAVFLISDNAAGISKLLSPAIEFFAGELWCWTYSSAATPIFCELRKASAIFGAWNAPTLCDLELPNSAREPWHFDVSRIPNGWAMLIGDRPKTGTSSRNTWLAYSKDGVVWGARDEPFSTDSPSTYRSAFVRDGAGFECWIGDHDARRIKRLRINDAQV